MNWFSWLLWQLWPGATARLATIELFQEYRGTWMGPNEYTYDSVLRLTARGKNAKGGDAAFPDAPVWALTPPVDGVTLTPSGDGLSAVITASAPATVTVTTTDGGKVGSVTLTFTPLPLDHIDITVEPVASITPAPPVDPTPAPAPAN